MPSVVKKQAPLIVIDGPSGVGKSTLAKEIAVKLSLVYLDTGALYRALAWKAQQVGEKLEELAQSDLMLFLQNTGINVKLGDINDGQQTSIDGHNISNLIRNPLVGRYASVISALPLVRKFLLNLQRGMGKKGGLVADGRDMGTVVFPEATVKLFLSATAVVRADRRYQELLAKGFTAQYEVVLQGINQRDQADSTRKEAPLKQADDAIFLETSNLDQKEVFRAAWEIITTRLYSS